VNCFRDLLTEAILCNVVGLINRNVSKMSHFRVILHRSTVQVDEMVEDVIFISPPISKNRTLPGYVPHGSLSTFVLRYFHWMAHGCLC